MDFKLNIKNWRFYLHDFWDKQLVDLLEYGFPLDFDSDAPLLSTEENHASAKILQVMFRLIFQMN